MIRARAAKGFAWIPGVLAGSLYLSVAQAAPGGIEDFAGDDESHQTVTEITLTNGEIVTVVYSQGRFEYPAQQQGAGVATADEESFRTLSTPQMSEQFIPGLFGYTAAGGPVVEQGQQVTRTNLRTGDYDETSSTDLTRAATRSLAKDDADVGEIRLPSTNNYSADYSLKASIR